jgi:hypothetical protein
MQRKGWYEIFKSLQGQLRAEGKAGSHGGIQQVLIDGRS